MYSVLCTVTVYCAGVLLLVHCAILCMPRCTVPAKVYLGTDLAASAAALLRGKLQVQCSAGAMHVQTFKCPTPLHCNTCVHSTANTQQYSALQLTALQRNALHCNALDCNALHCNALHCNALHCSSLHCNALHCNTLHYNALHSNTLHCNALHCNRHYTATHCTALHCCVAASMQGGWS